MAMTAMHQLYFALTEKPAKERMTPEEQSIITACNLKVLGTGVALSAVASTLAWQALKRVKRLNNFMRIKVVVVAGIGMSSLAYGVNYADTTIAVSYLDYILKQDSTRIQKELVNVLVTNNKNEAWRWNLMSKYFYPEAVYSDEGDKPQMRWRRRSTFTELTSSFGDGNEAKPVNSPSPNRNVALKTKPILGNSDGETEGEDVLDILFGGGSSSETTETTTLTPVSSKVSPNKTLTRKQKRAQRRKRIKNREASSSINTPQYELA